MENLVISFFKKKLGQIYRNMVSLLFWWNEGISQYFYRPLKLWYIIITVTLAECIFVQTNYNKEISFPISIILLIGLIVIFLFYLLSYSFFCKFYENSLIYSFTSFIIMIIFEFKICNFYGILLVILPYGMAAFFYALNIPYSIVLSIFRPKLKENNPIAIIYYVLRLLSFIIPMILFSFAILQINIWDIIEKIITLLIYFLFIVPILFQIEDCIENL